MVGWMSASSGGTNVGRSILDDCGSIGDEGLGSPTSKSCSSISMEGSSPIFNFNLVRYLINTDERLPSLSSSSASSLNSIPDSGSGSMAQAPVIT